MAAAPDAPRKARSLVTNLVLVLVAFGLLAWTAAGNREQIQKVLAAQPNRALLLLAFGCYMVALLMTFCRWFLLVRALGLPFRFADALRLGFIGNVFNLVIPGAVGGDLIKATFLCREQAQKTLAVASLVIDRAVGLLGLFLLAGLAGLVAWSTAGTEVRGLILFTWVAIAAGFVGLAILFSPALYRPLLRLTEGRGKLHVLLQEFVTLSASYRQRLNVVAGALVFSVLSHSLFVSSFTAVDFALYGSEAPSIGRHFVIVPLALFTMAVPLPFGALGVSENASKRLFDLVGFPGGAVVMMAYRLIMFASVVVSLIFYLTSLRQIRALRTQAERLETELEHGDLVDPSSL